MFYVCLALTIGVSYIIIKNPHIFGIKEEKITEKIKTIILIVAAIIFFGGSTAISYLGPGTTMGSPFERSAYTEKYYIEMYDPETDKLIGTYPAKIECDTFEEDYNDHTYRSREYWVDTIYAPNNQIWCDSDSISLGDIEEGNKIRVNDSNIGSFDVRITKSKVQ